MKNMELLLPRGVVNPDRWTWATVTQAAPLRIRIDGDTAPLDLTPELLFRGATVGQRVWVQFNGRRAIVHSAANGADPALTGEIKMWSGVNLPSGYLWGRGGTFLSTDQPALAAIVGDTYGTHSGTTYYLPDFRARSPIGIGGAATGGGSVGNIYSLGQKYGHEAMPTHNHGVTDPSHAHGGVASNEMSYNKYESVGGAGLSIYFGGGSATHTGYGGLTNIQVYGAYTGISIQNAGSGNMGNVHPSLGTNFIIKT